MRRSLTLALAILLAASAFPTALASPSALHMELPERALGPDEIVPVNVTLVIEEFMCSNEREFSVLLVANATFGVKATFARTNLTFTTPPHTYFAEPYRQTQTVNLTVRALAAGEVELTATFPEHDRGPCLVPDGFQPSTTTRVVPVVGPSQPPPGETPPTPEDETEPMPPDATPTPPPSPTAAPPVRSTACAPDTTCGYIGDFAASESTEGDRDVPAPTLFAALAALGVAAVIVRRKT